MRTLTDDSTYLLIFAEAERNARHRLLTQAYLYTGQINVLIETIIADTALGLPHEVLSQITADDLRDVCIGAAHEGMVNFYKRDIA